MKFTPAVSYRLGDPTAEAIRRNQDQRINELQALPSVDLTVIPGVQLPDGVSVIVPHKLGRRPQAAWPSFIVGAVTAGVIQDFKSTTPAGNHNDLTKTLSLRATGFGATITVDIMVI